VTAQAEAARLLGITAGELAQPPGSPFAIEVGEGPERAAQAVARAVARAPGFVPVGLVKDGAGGWLVVLPWDDAVFIRTNVRRSVPRPATKRKRA
jgi:hypothetical protein